MSECGSVSSAGRAPQAFQSIRSTRRGAASRHLPSSVTRKSLVLALVSRAAERDPMPYALETDWPVGAGGFEPLHLRIEFAKDSQPGAGGLEPLHFGIEIP